MATHYMVVGEYQYDEESWHWNVCGFTDHLRAEQHIKDIQTKIAEFLPQYEKFMNDLRSKHDVFSDEYRRLQYKAEDIFLKRIGDKQHRVHHSDIIQYSVEPVEIY